MIHPSRWPELARAFDKGLAAFEEYCEWKLAHREPEPMPRLLFHFAAAQAGDDDLRIQILRWLEDVSRQLPN